MPSPEPSEAERPKEGAPPQRRSRSRSPVAERADRRSSKSPPRGPKAKSFSGLKWKTQDRQDRRDDGDGRGYRDRDRDSDRRFDRHDRSDRDRSDGHARERADRNGRSDRYDRNDRNDRNDRSERDRRVLGPERPREERKPRSDKPKSDKPKSDKPKAAAPAPQRAPAPSAPAEEMIIVTVNDRLGTKAQIPCLASDPIRVFKAMVAARIGRAPHEIMIKRQGERPMKDVLTLEDYGVSHGVQLDLELDTGD